MITISLGIKPENGGRPAKDSSRSLMVAVIKGPRLNNDISWDLDEIRISTENKGIVIKEYKMKYRRVMLGILILKVLSIQPECVIEE